MLEHRDLLFAKKKLLDANGRMRGRVVVMQHPVLGFPEIPLGAAAREKGRPRSSL